MHAARALRADIPRMFFLPARKAWFSHGQRSRRDRVAWIILVIRQA